MSDNVRVNHLGAPVPRDHGAVRVAHGIGMGRVDEPWDARKCRDSIDADYLDATASLELRASCCNGSLLPLPEVRRNHRDRIPLGKSDRLFFDKCARHGAVLAGIPIADQDDAVNQGSGYVERRAAFSS
jgi:hypothetical protein